MVLTLPTEAVRSGLPLSARAGDQLAALAAMAGMSDVPRMTSILTRMLGTSAGRTAATPAYPSDVVDDQSPYEFSITIGGVKPELRVLVETDDGDPSLAGRWRAGLAASAWLRDHHGADLSRLERVTDVFEPRSSDARLAIWHAIVFAPEAAPKAKAYFDLRAKGRELARSVLEEALARLELSAAYPWLVCEAARRGSKLDELVYFSLDLSAHERARIKVYFRHHDATARDVERTFGSIGGIQPGDIREFCTTMLGDEGPYSVAPLVSCWSFTPDTGPASVPSGATLCVPIAYYANDDGEAFARVQRWLAGTSLGDAESERYRRAVAVSAHRPLEAGTGMHSHVSIRREGGKPKLTSYLAPEAYHTFTPAELCERSPSSRRRPSAPAKLVNWYEDVERCTDHPLFRRLEREPVALEPLWTILANNWVAIGDRFPRWLSALIARVEDDRVRSVLAKQLNDELGHGDPSQAHRVLFQRMLADLEPCAPKDDRDMLLAPGRRLRDAIGHNYLDKPELEAIGGTLIAEVYGKQVDQVVLALLRRQRELDPERLTWLVLHDSLEEDHANESVELAEMTPPDRDAQAAVCRGIDELAAHAARYFDEIYALVFPS
jgi:DMATS type aromatic prenyltransferase